MNTFWMKPKSLIRIISLNRSQFTSKHNNLLLNKQFALFSQKIRDTKINLSQNTEKTQSNKLTRRSNKHSQSFLVEQDEFASEKRSVQIRSLDQKQPKQIQEFFELDQEGKLKAIEMFKNKKKIKELSIIAKDLLFESDKSKSEIIWCALQQAFISLLQPTKDQNKIRSLSKFLYSLGKSKRATHNYETQMALLLPFSSPQSFTQIITTISRMGGMSEEFSHIVEKLYWKRKEEFSPLEMNLINYVLAKNGKKIDVHLMELIEKFPLRSIVLMLRAYDMADMMTPQVLKKCVPAIVARKRETNFLDFRGIFNIYCKYLYLDNQNLINYLEEQYRILARNVNEEALEQIWEYFPRAVNANKLPIVMVEDIIKSLKILRTRARMSERTWKKIALSFGDFENLQIRTQLQKI